MSANFIFFVNSITNKNSKWLTEHASVLLVVARLLVAMLLVASAGGDAPGAMPKRTFNNGTN